MPKIEDKILDYLKTAYNPDSIDIIMHVGARVDLVLDSLSKLQDEGKIRRIYPFGVHCRYKLISNL